ncbi:PH domain-containing protein [Jatrophihabitans sp. DSM 45814]
MLLIHPVREIIRFIPALIGIFLAGRSSGEGHWWSLIGLGVVLILSVTRWVSTSFRITADQVQLRTGLFRRRIIATPADRVRTVDVTAHALHRVLGLARVAIGTGTYDRKREGLVLDGLPTEDARALRAELLHRSAAEFEIRPPAASQGAATDANDAGWQPDSPAEAEPAEVELLTLNPAWVRYAPFTLSGAVTALAVAGFSWNVLSQAQVNASKLDAVQSASRQLRDSPLWWLVMQVVISLLVVITVLSAIGYLLAFWNFRLSRHSGGTLHVSRGLITTRATSIEHRRLRGVDLSEPILLRAVGGERMTAVATGLRVGRGSERGGTVLAPPGPRRRIEDVATQVLAGSAELVRGELLRHDRNALRRRLMRATLPVLVVSVVLVTLWWRTSLPAWVPLLALALLAVSPLLGLDRYRSLGHLISADHLVTRYGSLDRRRVILQTDAIIGWNVRQTIFQRRLGLVTLAATTAAGRQHYRLTDVQPDEAIRVARLGTPGLLEQFLVPDASPSNPGHAAGRPIAEPDADTHLLRGPANPAQEPRASSGRP